MTRFSTLFLLLTLTALIETEPPNPGELSGPNSPSVPKEPDSSGSNMSVPLNDAYESDQTKPNDPVSILLGSTPMSNGTTEPIASKNIPVNGTKPVTIGSVRNPLIVPLADRANLFGCNNFHPDIYCYIGNNCLGSTARENHTEIVKSDDMRFFTSRSRMYTCDVGFTMRKTMSPGLWNFEYHTTDQYVHLPVVVRTDRYINIIENTLICEPLCDIDIKNEKSSKKSFFWSGTVTFHAKRAPLKYCFSDLQTHCYVGNLCLKGETTGVHDSIVNLSVRKRKSLKSKEQRAVKQCNVGAVLTKFKRGDYIFDYHSSHENKHLILQIQNRVYRNVTIGKDDKLTCDPRCKFRESRRYRGNHYWHGDLTIFTVNATELTNKPNKIAESEKDTSEKEGTALIHSDSSEIEEEKKSEESQGLSLGAIVLISLIAIVVFLVLAVVVVTMIQKHHAAKIKLRHAAITAAAQKNMKSKEKESLLKKKPIVPILDDDSATSERTGMDERFEE